METAMGISYELAEDLQKQVNELARMLFPHVKLDSVVCLRSYGSSSRGTIARCHALGKAMQLALNRKGFYVIEVINKRFDKMSEEEKTKTLIHELMHIPKSFGGGFIHHNIVHERNVERMYQHYVNLKKRSLINEANGDRIIEDRDIIYDNNLTKGHRIEKAISDSARTQPEFFVVLDKPQTEFVSKKKRNWWF